MWEHPTGSREPAGPVHLPLPVSPAAGERPVPKPAAADFSHICFRPGDEPELPTVARTEYPFGAPVTPVKPPKVSEEGEQACRTARQRGTTHRAAETPSLIGAPMGDEIKRWVVPVVQTPAHQRRQMLLASPGYAGLLPHASSHACPELETHSPLLSSRWDNKDNPFGPLSIESVPGTDVKRDYLILRPMIDESEIDFNCSPGRFLIEAIDLFKEWNIAEQLRRSQPDAFEVFQRRTGGADSSDAAGPSDAGPSGVARWELD